MLLGMRRLRLALAPLPVAAAVLLGGACHQKPTSVVLSMLVTQGLLDGAKLTLRVIEGASCNTATGAVGGSFDDEDVLTFGLRTSGCEAGASFCADVTVEQGDTPKVFEVFATRSNQRIAQGCTRVLVNQDPLAVDVSIVPFFEPKCCNDGRLQVGEQCDPGLVADTDCRGAPTGGAQCSAVVEDFVCHCDCLAREIVLSEASLTPPALGNSPDLKAEPAFAFSGGNAQGGIPGSFRAVFTDYEGDGNGDIDLRVLDADLQRAPGLLGQPVRLPQDCESVASGVGPALGQIQPDIARVNDDLMLVAFADDRDVPGAHEIRVLTQNAWGCNDESPPSSNVCTGAGCAPTKLGTVQSGVERFPAIANGTPERTLVVWVNGTSLRGRVWVPGADSSCSTCLPAAEELTFGVDIEGRPRVAGGPGGFVVAYAIKAGNNTNVFYRPVSLEGVIGAEVKVNTTDGAHDQPAVAALPDGRFVVVWRTAESVIHFQRYDAAGVAVPGDQEVPLSVDSPPGFDPAVAAPASGGTFFAAAWAAIDGTVWARFIDAEETFLRNSVNGLLTDFLASHPGDTGGFRVTPDVAIGGNGWVAIGWADRNADGDSGFGRGIRVRRFPLPE